ncbi:hypothetical protein HNR16_001254 [Pseudoclavibacter chungangensis]|uniref:DUF3000 domain-containing protein n=1 Tax=Pseudoclavibacter chungangensis TaxID=587635 RepID=UPI0015CE7333|nr:DUF3000 domain-containing protein [Pseudoclavibacter chungangensis]NYJ66466.1 hypothetical protein [Pseudoclavibacter chungangensis]
MVVSLNVPPDGFEVAAASVREATFRSELEVAEIRPPSNLAPDAIALSGDVHPANHEEDSEFGTGRFVLLHDPDEPEAWRGSYRVVCFAQAPLEPEIGVDPFLSDVAWSWLVEALESRGALFEHPSGTATIVNAKGFGELDSQGEGSQIELRASWTPRNYDFGSHAAAWGELVCMLAGLPPVESDRVVSIRHRRGPRDAG